MVNMLALYGELSPPLPIPHSDFSIVQYADDTLLTMQACPAQVTSLKNLLHDFARATSLKVNYSKSCMMPINITDERLNELATVFGCAAGSLPFNYIGLPVGIACPTMLDLAPVSDQIERRLNPCARFLPYGGRLTLINSVLSLLPTYLMCTLKL